MTTPSYRRDGESDTLQRPSGCLIWNIFKSSLLLFVDKDVCLPAQRDELGTNLTKLVCEQAQPAFRHLAPMYMYIRTPKRLKFQRAPSAGEEI